MSAGRRVGVGGEMCRCVGAWAYRRFRGAGCQRVLQSVIQFVENLLLNISCVEDGRRYGPADTPIRPHADTFLSQRRVAIKQSQ